MKCSTLKCWAHSQVRRKWIRTQESISCNIFGVVYLMHFCKVDPFIVVLLILSVFANCVTFKTKVTSKISSWDWLQCNSVHRPIRVIFLTKFLSFVERNGKALKALFRMLFLTSVETLTPSRTALAFWSWLYLAVYYESDVIIAYNLFTLRQAENCSNRRLFTKLPTSLIRSLVEHWFLSCNLSRPWVSFFVGET